MLALVLPLCAVDIPPVLDYPNHLAAAYVLAFGPTDPVLSQIYAPHWAIIPNLAINLLLPPLMHLLQVHIAGRLVLGASLLLPWFGVIIYHRARFAGRSAWPLASALVAYNLTFLLGFMNFQLGLGFALLAAAIWAKFRESRPALAVAGTSAGAVGVFFCHLLALPLLAALICGQEVQVLTARADGARRTAAFRRAALAGAVFAMPVLLYVRAPLGREHGAVHWVSLPSKILVLFAPLMNYSLAFDVATGLLLAACLIIALRRNWLEIPRSSATALLLLFGAYLVSPIRLQGGYYFDTRFAVMIGYVLFAGLNPSAPPRRVAMAALAGFFVLFGSRMTLVTWAWRAHAAQVAQMREAIAPIPAGSPVLVAAVTMQEAPAYWSRVEWARRIDGLIPTDRHLPALLLIEHRAFWPLLFTGPAQQPLFVIPPYQALTSQSGEPPPSQMLASGPQTAIDRRDYGFLLDWQSHFDFLVLLDAGGMADPVHFLPDRLQLLRRTDQAALFRVRGSSLKHETRP